MVVLGEGEEEGGGGVSDPYFFLHISSSWVNQLPGLSGSALTVSLVGGVGLLSTLSTPT